MTLKQFIIRVLKERKYLFNNIKNDELFSSIINSIFIDTIIDVLLKKYCIGNIPWSRIINREQYNNILPKYNERFVIANIKNRKKFVDYLNDNGMIWQSLNVIKITDDCFKQKTLTFEIRKGLCCWSEVRFWNSPAYSFLNENKINIEFEDDEEFYIYFDKLKEKANNYFNNNINVNFNYII